MKDTIQNLIQDALIVVAAENNLMLQDTFLYRVWFKAFTLEAINFEFSHFVVSSGKLAENGLIVSILSSIEI